MQAQQLDGRIGSSFTIKPDQFQAVNPIIIVFLVPLFDFVIYPLFAKINLLKRPLQRMCVGLLFGIAAFIIAAILESRMQAAIGARNPTDRIRVLNLAPCDLQLDVNNSFINIRESQLALLDSNNLFAAQNQGIKLNVNAFCAGNQTFNSFLTISNTTQLPRNLLIYLENNQIKSSEYVYDNKNSVIGYSLVKYDVFRANSFGILDITIGNNIVKYQSQISLNDLLKDSNLYSNGSYKRIDYADYDLRFVFLIIDIN
jgi:hypothetical protein